MANRQSESIVIEGLHSEGSPVPRTALRRLSSLPHTRLLASGFLSLEEQRALEGAVSPVKTVAANIDLVREGERADMISIVINGWACRYTATREGGRQLPALLVSGDVGNLNSLIFDQLDYGVRTITAATIVALPLHRVTELAARHPGIARTFSRVLIFQRTLVRFLGSRRASSFHRGRA